MKRTRHDKIINKLLEGARDEVYGLQRLKEEALTKELRAKYKGKNVKCSCFDAWIDGDDYFFNDKELIDIQAYSNSDGDGFHVMVTFMYKSCFSENGPKPCKFHLESIEKATVLKKKAVKDGS